MPASISRHGGVVARVPTPEDLVIMKAVARRYKDFDDICAIVKKYPKLDRTRIQKKVREFAEALDMPEIWGDVAPLLGEKD